MVVYDHEYWGAGRTRCCLLGLTGFDRRPRTSIVDIQASRLRIAIVQVNYNKVMLALVLEFHYCEVYEL